eukprot:3769421-Amphidinium_carterae.2
MVPVSICPLSLPKSGNIGAVFVRLRITSGSWCVRNCAFVLDSGPGSVLLSLKYLEQLGQLCFRLHRLRLSLINVWLSMRPMP